MTEIHRGTKTPRVVRAGFLLGLFAILPLHRSQAQAVCGTPGKEGPGGTLSGVVNTYYPGITASASAGSNTITLGPSTGASAPITPGDLLLVIQMQGSTINAANTSNYGAGSGTGHGVTEYGGVGRYEYVTATNSVGLGGGVVTFRGTGAGNGLINGYAAAAATGAVGQRRYQIVRVPQYSSATLGSGLTAAYWNGITGGILAIDVAGQLTLGGTVSVDGRGFRGGAGLGFGGGAGGTNGDFRNLSTNPFHGIKGEGIAGTPKWVLDPASGTNVDLGFEGYPSGDAAQGGPGNAGGGGTDGNPAGNDQNSGGGGGSNGGAGGQGGFSWSSGLDRGGRGGDVFAVGSVSRVLMGGGGGAGSRNNSAAPQNAGGAGGGIVLIRAGRIAGSGTITANGLTGRSPANDGAGGGGAGGSVAVLATAGGLGGLTVQARGGAGGSAWASQAGAASAHGPGGGGGGGLVILSSAGSVDVGGGSHGITTSGNLAYGATDGVGGQSLTAPVTATPGTSTGSLCEAGLTVVKSTSTPTVNNGTAGTLATYTIVVINAANRDTARQVVILDSLPTGFTFASALAPVFVGGASRPSVTDPAVGATIPQWSTFTLPGGSRVSQTFTVNVAPTVPNGVYNNPARIIYLDPERTTPTGTATVAYDTSGAGENVTVRGADLTITKTHVGSFSIGVNASYTIVPRNAGNRPSSGTVTVTDTLPAGLSFVSATGTGWTCGAIGQVVSCSRGNAIGAGANAPAITLTVGVGAAAAPSVTNRVWVGGGNEPDGNRANNSATDPTTVIGASADVGTTKTGPATVSAGANAAYTILVSNAGPAAATGIVVTDTLPAGASFVSATGGGTIAGNVVTWPAIATMANGGSASFTVTVTYANGGSYTDIAASTATTADPNPANNDGSAPAARVTTVVTPIANLTVTKTGPASGSVGANNVYTIGVDNSGPSAAADVVVTDTLPAGAVFVSASGGGTVAGGVVTWPTVPSLAAAGSLSFTVTLSYPAAGSYADIAAAASPTTDPSLPNRATATTTIAPSAEVAITNVGPATATAGANVAYTITATNNGPSPAAGVVVTDTLPPGAVFVSATGGGVLVGNVVTWPAIGSLPNGASISYTLTLSYPVAGNYTNVAAVASTTADPNLANNVAPVTTAVGTSADVVATKTGPASVAAGAAASYSISVVNNGPSAAANVVVTDTLPAGATFVSASSGGAVAGNVVTWPSVASLANGASVGYTVTVTYSTVGTYTDIVASTAATPDPTPANNNGSAPGARVSTTVTAAADLAVSKTGPSSGAPGVDLTYTISVRNNGPSTATAVVVTDTIPAGMTFVSASAGGTLAAGVVTWPAVASIPNGGTSAVTVTLRAASAGTYTDVAAVRSSSVDPSLADNRATATTVVSAPAIADVATTKTGPAVIASGGTLVYTIQTINNGPAAALDVVITDTLPLNATFVSATGGATRVGNVLTWPSIPSLANGASVTHAVTLTATGSGTIVNIAASSSTTPDPVPGNNNGSATTSRTVTTIVASADLVTTKTGPTTAVAGVPVSYSISVHNAGPDAAADVAVIDSIPAGTQFVSATDGGVFAAGVVTWPVVATLPSGATLVRSVTLVSPTAGTITNVARVNSTTPDPNGSNDRATATTSLTASADVITTKSGPATVDAGGSIGYTITVRNAGPNPAAAVIVTDTLPVGVTFVNASAGGVLTGRVVSWPAIASLAVNESVVYTVTVTAPTSGGVLTNIVASTSDTPDPRPDNNDGTDPGSRVVTEVAPVDLAIVKSHVGNLVPGTVATYNLVVSNVGSTATIGPIVVRDTLPVGLTFRSAQGSGWSCTSSAPVVTCRYDAVPFSPDATTTIVLEVLVAADAPASVTNRAHVSTPGDSEDSGNNVSSDEALVSRVSPITVEKLASRTDAEVADVVDYTVVVTNHSGATVPGVSVIDVLPKGFSYQRKTARVDLIPIADPAGAPGPTLTFTIGDLEPNTAVRLTYRVKIGAGATLGDGTNRARARSGTGLESPEAIVVVRVRGGVFSDRAIVVGKVFLRCDCDSTRAGQGRSRFGPDSLGVPGVRLFLEDGTSVVTDLEGNYNFSGLISGLHVVRVDPTTLPRGARLLALDNRSAGDSSSRFVDLKNGELHKADFALQYGDSIRGGIDLRRERGDVQAAIIDSIAGIATSDTLTRALRPAAVADADRGVIAVDQASDSATTPAYRPLAATTSANPIDEANRLPIRRLPGTTAPLAAVPNGSVELVPARRSLPADGNTAVAIRVRVLDQERQPIATEQPITLETSLGRWLVQDLDPVEPGIQTGLTNGQGDFTLVASSEAGVGEIRVTNGLRIGTVQMVFVPAERPLFVNGLVEARVDLRSLLRDGLLQVTSADRFERELADLRATSDDGKFSAAARGALFLQGKIKGSTLLTLAFDSERDPERRMFRDIQPEEFYPVYGDASIKEFGAQSFDRLYVRVDAQRSFLLYGDYVTPAAGTGVFAARELGAYQRSLTGGLVHGENAKGQFDLFASRDRLSQVVEEIPGRGISGPYQLGRTDGRLNSEKVEIVTRDRNQPSRILEVTPLARFTDYTLEPFTGRLLFFSPVPSVDADLNPVSIRVTYEVERSGDEFWVYGADGQLKVGDRVEFGAGIVRDEQPSSNRQLYSANAAFALGAGTVLVTEFARTGGDSVGFKGDAARFELRHASAKFQGSVFGATSDAGFSNQSSTFQRGRAELGLRGTAVLDDRTRLLGEALRTEDRIGGGRRTGALIGVERQFGKFVRGELGYRFAQEDDRPASPGTAVTPGATPNETNAIRTRITLQVPGQPKASVFGEFEQDVANGDQHRGALGGQYVLFDRLRLYGRHEFLNSFAGPFALNGAQRQATTVIGLDAGYTKDGQFFGEYRASDAFSGRETEAAIGLRNRWSVAKGLVINTGFERVDVLRGTGVGEATAITAGAEYTTNPNWRGTARFEYRFAPRGDDFLATLGYVRRLDRDWTFLGRALYNTFGDGGKRTRNQIGFAWRETDRNRWNGLARWENRYERLTPNSSNESIGRSNILSAHLNYQPTHRLWLSGRFAGKWAKELNGGLETSSQGTLISVRGLYDFLPRWDAGVIGSSMWSGGRQYGVGLELGRTVVQNLRAAIGYNLFGFRDGGLVGDGSQTDHGLYLHIGFKFDEDSFRKMAGESRQR